MLDLAFLSSLTATLAAANSYDELPSSMSSSFPTVAAAALTSPPSSLHSGPIIWHAVSATVAWGLLAPISLLLARGQSKSERIPVHRATMIATLILTIQAYIFAIIYTPRSSAAPPQHPILTSALVLICVIQSVAAGLRPAPLPNCAWRQAWRVVHRSVGISLVLFALYILRHSVYVFSVDGWLRIFVFSFATIGMSIWVIALVASLYASVSGHSSSKSLHQDNYEKVAMEEGHSGQVFGSFDSSGQEQVEGPLTFVTEDDVR